MKRLSGALLAGLIGAAAAAQDAPFETAATHAVIMDFDTGIVLYDKAGDEPMPPASMLKIMTVLLTFEALKGGSITMDTEFVTSEHAWRTGGFASGSSTMCLTPNERVTVSNLLRGVIVLSGNDASIVLAEGLAGSEESFAADMQDRAEDLGLTGSTFRNSTGLPDPDQRVSAHDLAEIARVTIRDHPDLYPIYAETEFDFCDEAPTNRYNRNPVLGLIEGADGLKTGHTEESGYGLVASALRDGERRIVVFSGLTSEAGRSQEAERLMRAAFADFKISHPFKAGDQVGELPVYMGERNVVPVRVDEDVVVGHHRRAARDATARVVFETPLRAPVREGDAVGTLVIEVPGQPKIEKPVVAAASVPKAGLMDQARIALFSLIRGEGDDDGESGEGGDG
jgi:D-alanyl-D-alanine carboxypeptidase (penicillin-binding protein 5/6)